MLTSLTDTFNFVEEILFPCSGNVRYVSKLHPYDTRSAYSGNFQLKSVRLTMEKSAISYIGPKIWNNIENQINPSCTNGGGGGGGRLIPTVF